MGYAEVSVVVRGVGEVPLLLRLLRAPCSPEVVVDVGRIAPPRGLISSSVVPSVSPRLGFW